mgnify:CR=1 FL=1
MSLLLRTQSHNPLILKIRIAISVTLLLSGYTFSVHDAAACDESKHHYTYGYTYDIRNANGNGAQAAWEEQDYEVADYTKGADRFAASVMWVLMSTAPLDWVEVGFMRSQWCPGNCFYRTRGKDGLVTHLDKVSKAPKGAHNWHVYRLIYSSSTGAWHTYIDGTHYGGYSHKSTGEVIEIGNEVTSNCTIVHITYFGSPSTSSSYAFQYRTGNGVWTTWGSGNVVTNPPYRHEWLTYAIYQRTWGP